MFFGLFHESRPWKNSKTSVRSKYGRYYIKEINGQEYLYQYIWSMKDGERHYREMALPVSSLTDAQKMAWKVSVRVGVPRNPLTGKKIDIDGQTAGMIRILMNRN